MGLDGAGAEQPSSRDSVCWVLPSLGLTRLCPKKPSAGDTQGQPSSEPGPGEHPEPLLLPGLAMEALAAEREGGGDDPAAPSPGQDTGWERALEPRDTISARNNNKK